MAGFLSPSILFLNTWDAPERKYMANLLKRLPTDRYPHYHEPAVGGFAMPLVAASAGIPAESMTTSDTHLFTSVIGEIAAGRTMEALDVRLDGQPLDYSTLTDPASPIEQGALVVYSQYVARIQAKSSAHYWETLKEDLETNRAYHLGQFGDQLRAQTDRLQGLKYTPQSVWGHLEAVADDPQAVVVSNPPTYPGAYEQFFDTKGRLEWATPDYEEFNAPVDIPRMVEFMEGREALLVVQQQQTPRNSAHPKPVYARQLAPGQLVYLNSNRPDEVREIMGGIRFVPRKVADHAKRTLPVIPPDHPITPETEIQLVEVESKVADAYRREWMHRLYPVPGSGNVLVVVDGYAAGVMGYSVASISSSYNDKWEKHAILRFAFGAKHERYRLTRLATTLALQKSTLALTATPASTMQIAYSQGLVTVEMTRHPEAKGLRGLMKLADRQKHPDGYKLVYAAEWRDEDSPQSVLGEFITKEEQWLAKRK